MTDRPGDLARLYAAQISDFDADIPLWLALAQAQGGAVLELGCGPGRVLLALARAGFQVWGIDRDPAMLAHLRSRLIPDLARRVSLHRADLRNFHLPGPSFALILCPCNTFAYLEQAGARAALRRAHGHLAPRGLLALDLPNPNQDLLDAPDPQQPILLFRETQTGHPVQLYARQEVDRRTRLARVTWRYDELLPDGQVRSLSLRRTYHLRSASDMEALLHAAGFDAIHFYGDYDRSPLEADSPRMLALAHKAGEPASGGTRS